MARFVFDWDPGYKKGVLQSDCLDVLREALSIEDKDASMARYKTERKWTSMRKYPISQGGRFSLGLFPEIYKKIKTLDIPYTTIITEKFKENFLIGWNKSDDFVPVELDMPPRYYQRDCIKQCMKYGNGVVMLGTAGGKTLIMAMLLHNINLIKKSQTLIITSPTLMAQAIDDFIGFGIHKYYTMSQWDANHPYTDTDIVIASSNILMSKKQDKRILSTCGLVLIDECFRANTNINTITGLKQIKDIKRGDYVLSYNINTKKNEYKEVLNTHKNIPLSTSYNYYLKIELENGKFIECTPNHKIYTKNRGYVRADELNNDDDLHYNFEINDTVP